jgi:ankyrin repeat protein
MRDMYLIEPINFDDILRILSELEHRINLTMPLLSLGEALVKQRGEELVQSVTKILNTGANVNDTSWNGHRPLQLLIKAKLESRKKLELVKRLVSLGADIHSADKSGLTPYQVAISEKNKPISDLLRSKGARPMSPPGTGYAQHYDMYHEIPLP